MVCVWCRCVRVAGWRDKSSRRGDNAAAATGQLSRGPEFDGSRDQGNKKQVKGRNDGERDGGERQEEVREGERKMSG